jgi:rhamnulokinase
MTGLWILQECLREWEKEGLSFGWGDLIAAASTAKPFRSLIDPEKFQAPGNMPEAIRAYCRAGGQAVPETVGEVARCCFESLSLAYWSTLEALLTLTGGKINTLRVVGGGCLNTFLCQMTADACGCSVVSGPAEASALGNVMLQAVAVGELESVADGRASVGESPQLVMYEPQSGEGWDEARERHRRLTAGYG